MPESENKNNNQVSRLSLVVFLIVSVVLSLLVVKVTWNNSVSRIFNLPEISLLEALSLVVLVNILFSSVGSSCIQMVAK